MEKWRVYVREALKQLEFAKRSFAEFEEAEALDDVASIFFHLHHFIVHVTNVDKLLDPKPGSERAILLKGLIDFSSIDFKPIRRLRNHLEHFDERLDMWVKNFDGQTFFDMNIVTGTRGFPEKAFLRALDGRIFKFHGENYELDPLLQTTNRLFERLSYLDTR
jgi:hypothetical protein